MSNFVAPEIKGFKEWDYVVFAALLVVSAGIGVFFAIKERKKKTSNEFLVGGRQMTCGPVALSLTASFMSAITVLGTPSEVVRFGAYYLYFIIAYTFVITFSAELFIPVFYRSGITSTYEYLELRFSRVVRYAATIMYIIQTILYTGVVVYAPALALNQVTGFNLWGSVFATGIVCTFYCTLGGLKAVVWTDAFQMVVMVIGFLSVLIEGTIQNGGPTKIWETAMNGSRLDILDFSPDPLQRHTFWTIAVGGTFTWLGIYGVNQSTVQRCISCKTEKHAKLALYLNLVGLWIILVCAVFSGLVMYAHFQGCDPWTAGFISAPDQMMPYFVMTIFSSLPGLPGLFVACAFSGTLSTVAASINALATVTYEDIVKNIFKNISDKKSTWISKGLCVVFGVLCTVMAVVASFMGGVVQAALSIHGMCGGPMLGLFTLGILFPCTNWKGALGGLLTGFVMSFWVGIGGFIYPAPPSKTFPLELRTDECILANVTSNTTELLSTYLPTTLPTTAPSRSLLADNWYSISYLYYSAVGCLSCIIAGLLISFITGREHGRNIKPLLIRPICNLFCFWSDKYKEMCWCGVPHDTEEDFDSKDILHKDINMTPVTEVPTENGYDRDSTRKPPPGYNEAEKSYTNVNVEKVSQM
ncbi:sodium-coupled monocarboxylate transporter 2 isoform X2 [Spea bombifrons]|uniref:sodium-coupled monocarboxylate transporter 2 isoform X2 n=1 Tax=Spea bombifrons TaxID=233779 RepID=UPI00234ABD3E|nr:sodium-coupled monocarboxylate transporter 2 isoform X2 [Spea bombifrons]XP_053305145.1 sodium-coupled monocarboxylate transporter 2 isoform X2 [Spea bombifrons]